MPATKAKKPATSGKKSKKSKKKKDRCWEGYEPTPGKKAGTKGSCRKKKNDKTKNKKTKNKKK